MEADGGRWRDGEEVEEEEEERELGCNTVRQQTGSLSLADQTTHLAFVNILHFLFSQT